jgi:hypothetical protein
MWSPQDIADFFNKEGKVIVGAPATFAIAVFLLGGLTWWITSAHYTALITIKDQHLEVKDEQLKGKDDLITEYRERLGILPPAQSPFERLSNRELQQRALAVVGKLQRLITEEEKESQQIYRSFMSPQDATEEEKSRRWQQQTRKLTEHTRRFQSDYTKQFRADTILLRDALRSRLVEEQGGNFTIDTSYEFPTNITVIKEVADHLETLAKRLPTEGSSSRDASLSP